MGEERQTDRQKGGGGGVKTKINVSVRADENIKVMLKRMFRGGGWREGGRGGASSYQSC